MKWYTIEHVNTGKHPWWRIWFIFHLNGTTRNKLGYKGLHPNFNYSCSKYQQFVSTYRVSNNLQNTYTSILQSITVYINLSRKHRLFRENLIHYRVFLGQFEVNEPLEKDAGDTFLRRSATARYRFASSLPAINPFDAITNFRGQNALSLSFGFGRVWHPIKRISDTKFTQFTASRN